MCNWHRLPPIPLGPSPPLAEACWSGDKLKHTAFLVLVLVAVVGMGCRSYRDLARLPPHLLSHPRILLSLSAGSACCCWCVLPRPGSCGASSTPSCGTGGNTGRNRVLSAESQLPPGFQPGPSRGNLVSARAVAESQWVGSVCVV